MNNILCRTIVTFVTVGMNALCSLCVVLIAKVKVISYIVSLLSLNVLSKFVFLYQIT